MPSSPPARAFIALGGNLGDRYATLHRATAQIRQGAIEQTIVVAPSPIYETRPIGPSTEPFLNAVIEVRTELLPAPLLIQLLALEARHGRERRVRWDARTLDLDLLLYQPATAPEHFDPPLCTTDGITLPHPQLRHRDFVLRPLADLLGSEPLIDRKPAQFWLDRLTDDERTIQRVFPRSLLPQKPAQAGSTA